MAKSMHKFLLLVFPFLLSWTSLSSPTTFQDHDYERYNWKNFRALQEVNQAIDLQNPDYDLLNAAVFFATLRARNQEGHGKLTFDPALRNMAQYHSAAMARYGFVNHTNPRNPRYSTMQQRARQFKAQANAENVASTFLHRYKPGSYYIQKETPHGFVFYDSRSQREIKVHTYMSFAESVVKSWMNSPSHRHNILYRDMSRLGCACEIGSGELNSGEMPLAYCTQNFGF
jgi:uncharacterized protein YkwD